MKKTILSTIVIVAIGFSGYHFMQGDQEKSKTIKETNDLKDFSNTNVEQSKEELKEDFDYRLNMAKTDENGYRDGRCYVFGSPCMMEEVRLLDEKLERHKAAIAKANVKRDERYLLAKKEIEEIEEQNRLKREYEANRDFIEEVSEYTNVVDNTIDFQTASEISFEDSSWVDFIEDYNFKTPVERDKPITNYKVFKTATSEQYFKMFGKNGSFFMNVPLLTGNGSFKYTGLSSKDCELRDYENNSNRYSFTAKCPDHSISLFANEEKIEMTFYKEGNGYAHQFLDINNKGEMIVYNEHNEDGSRREFKNIDFSNFEGQKTKKIINFNIKRLTDML